MLSVFGPGDVALDLGTCTVLVYIKGRGVVLNEPSVVARDHNTGAVLAVGDEARKMIGRTPGTIDAIRPLRAGVISDFEVTEMMLRYFLKKAIGGRVYLKPRVIICVPTAVTSVERRAVLQAGIGAGARKVYLVEEPLAAALGAGLDISGASGYMVVDVGGGTTDIAVLSLNGVVVSTSTRIGGDALDEAIVRYVRKTFQLAIGEPTAELARITAGTLVEGARNEQYELRGRDLVTGLPRSIAVTSDDLAKAMEEPAALIVEACRQVLEKTPPEIASDIVDHGIVLTGGGALTHGMDVLLQKGTGLKVSLAEDPVTCVVRGAGLVLENIPQYEEHIRSLTV